MAMEKQIININQKKMSGLRGHCKQTNKQTNKALLQIDKKANMISKVIFLLCFINTEMLELPIKQNKLTFNVFRNLT